MLRNNDAPRFGRRIQGLLRNGCNPDVSHAIPLRPAILHRGDPRAHGVGAGWTLRACRAGRGGARVREVYFVMLPQLVLLDLAGPAEAFRMANRKAPDSYRLHFAAPIKSMQAAIGLQLSALEPLPSCLSEESIVVLT